MNPRTIAALVVSIVVAGQGQAAAQDTTAIKKALERVSADQTISVVDASGHVETGHLSASTEKVVTLDGTRSVAADRIARITVKDSTSNGAAIGAGIGLGAGVAGAIALGALCANEGGNCAAGYLMIVGLGVGAGAAIGWMGDSLKQHELYRADGVPHGLLPEARVRVVGSNGFGGGLGMSWSMTSSSGLGFEVNADRTQGAADGHGRGYSLDGRTTYTFGHARVRPFVSGGIGFVHHQQHYAYDLPPSLALPNGASFSGLTEIEGVVPVFGAGVRLQPARHLVIRPEVSWLIETQPNSANRNAVTRAGVSVGATW